MINVIIPDTMLTNRNNDNFPAFVTYRNKNGKIVNRKRLNTYYEDGLIDEFDNVPVSGIKVERLTSFNDKKDKNVYLRDPRGFIVKVPAYVIIDMMSVSSYNTVSGFAGEFIFGYDGINIIYVSTESDEYKNSLVIKNSSAISHINLIPGHCYIFPDNNMRLYLGKHPIINVDKSVIYLNSDSTDTVNDIPEVFHHKYTVDDVYIFFTKNNTYKIRTESDIQSLEFTEALYSPVSQTRIDNIMEDFYKNLYDRPEHFSNIVKIVPNESSSMCVCKQSYKINGKIPNIFWLFDKDFMNVIVYESCDSVFVCRKAEYTIDGNVLVKKMVSHKYKTCFKLTISNLVDFYAYTGRLYMSDIDIELPLESKCLTLVTDTGYTFNAYTHLVYGDIF